MKDSGGTPTSVNAHYTVVAISFLRISSTDTIKRESSYISISLNSLFIHTEITSIRENIYEETISATLSNDGCIEQCL